nr:hypothetical protein [Halieaceae bacterium]
MPGYIGSLAGLLLILAAAFFVRQLVSDHRRSDSLLNVSAGIAVAYAFVDVFPHLAKKQNAFSDFAVSGAFSYLYHNLYVVALTGFVVCVAVRAVQ